MSKHKRKPKRKAISLMTNPNLIIKKVFYNFTSEVINDRSQTSQH